MECSPYIQLGTEGVRSGSNEDKNYRENKCEIRVTVRQGRFILDYWKTFTR